MFYWLSPLLLFKLMATGTLWSSLAAHSLKESHSFHTHTLRCVGPLAQHSHLVWLGCTNFIGTMAPLQCLAV